MKNLLTTIGLSAVLLITTTARADISEENYNPHTNNHVGYAKAHSGNMQKMPKASMKMNKGTKSTTNDSSLYNISEDPFSLDYSHDH